LLRRCWRLFRKWVKTGTEAACREMDMVVVREK
jgi:hypothetical protein